MRPYEYTNDNDGFLILIFAFKPFDDSEIIIGLESTAHYSDNLYRYLVAHNYSMYVINSIQTSALQKNHILETEIKSPRTVWNQKGYSGII